MDIPVPRPYGTVVGDQLSRLHPLLSERHHVARTALFHTRIRQAGAVAGLRSHRQAHDPRDSNGGSPRAQDFPPRTCSSCPASTRCRTCHVQRWQRRLLGTTRSAKASLRCTAEAEGDRLRFDHTAPRRLGIDCPTGNVAITTGVSPTSAAHYRRLRAAREAPFSALPEALGGVIRSSR